MARQRNEEIANRCWEHYCRGWRIPEIAQELGVSALVVRGHIKASGEAAKAHRDALAVEMLQRELDGLDALERTVGSSLGQDAGPAVIQAGIKVILDIKARRAKYLGLDKPAEVKHSLSLEDLVVGKPAD